VGQLVGFDLRAAGSQAVDNVLGTESFVGIARHALHTFFRAVADAGPSVMVLEDIHWADDASLDLVRELAAGQGDARRLIVCLARPQFFEWRPNWGEGREAYTRHSRALVDELLGEIPELPAALRDLVVDGAEGNPYYVEELVKMLIDDGVIDRAAEGPWQVNADRLAGMRVPPTLTGVLQARLDSLPAVERETLQRASVVGREFWDVVVDRLGGEPQAAAGIEALHSTLGSLRSRAMVFQREQSAFAGACEYVFKHTILRDVIYESVLLKARREYHRRVAEWLVEHAGERVNEYLRLIGHHYELAGEGGKAAEFLRRAGKEAADMSLPRQALELFEHALRLSPPEAAAARGMLLTDIAREYRVIGDLPGAVQYLEQALALAQQADDWETEFEAGIVLAGMVFWGEDTERAEGRLTTCLALARSHGDRKREAQAAASLAVLTIMNTGRWDEGKKYCTEAVAIYQELGEYVEAAPILIEGLASPAYREGRIEEAEAYLQEARALLERIQDRKERARMLQLLGDLAQQQHDYEVAERHYLASLDAAREIGNQGAVASASGSLAAVARRRRRYADAERYHREAVDISRETGNRSTLAYHLDNLGTLALLQGDYQRATCHFEDTLTLCRENGDLWQEATTLCHLGHLHAVMGQAEHAWRCFRQALCITAQSGNTLLTMSLFPPIASLMADSGEWEQAAELLGLTLACPDTLIGYVGEWCVEPALAVLREALTVEALEAALERGKGLDVEQVVGEILAGAP
jgi:tetratricopeptide (TPR) repeat protein